MSDQRERPSFFARTFGPPICLILAVGALSWFVYALTVLFRDIQAEIVLIDKGSYYMLGVGISKSALAFIVVYEFWFGKALPDKLRGLCGRWAIAGLVVLFVFPHVMHFGADYYLKGRGYSVCDRASSQRMRFVRIVYAESTSVCDALPAKDNSR